MNKLVRYGDSLTSNNQTASATTTNSLLKCPSCSNENIITDSDSGELICVKCGRVISDKIQELRPEWRIF